MKLIVGLTFAALLLTGCGGSSSTTTPAAPLSASAKTSEGLTATLTQKSATVSAGDTVTYTLTLINATSAPISYQGKASDYNNELGLDASFGVYTPDGFIYYPAATPAIAPPPTHAVTITLQPGQSQTEIQSFPASFLTAGQYYAVGAFRTDNVLTDTPHLALRAQ